MKRPTLKIKSPFTKAGKVFGIDVIILDKAVRESNKLQKAQMIVWDYMRKSKDKRDGIQMAMDLSEVFKSKEAKEKLIALNNDVMTGKFGTKNRAELISRLQGLYLDL
jgi:hypothetical protein